MALNDKSDKFDIEIFTYHVNKFIIKYIEHVGDLDVVKLIPMDDLWDEFVFYYKQIVRQFGLNNNYKKFTYNIKLFNKIIKDKIYNKNI